MPHSDRRRRLTWLAAAALVLAAVVVLGVIHGRTRADPDSSSSAAPPSASAPRVSSSTPAPKPELPVGITFGGALFNLSRARVDDALDDVVALHMTWIRVDFSWAALEPRSAHAYEWHPMDAIVSSARAHHLHVLGLLTYTPPWARAPGCSSFTCPPRTAADFARFAATVVGRYRDDVTTYQIWNEPNIELFWRGPDPDEYGTLLDATVSAMRKVDPALHILFGGLAFASTSGGDVAPARFLVETCAHHTCDVDAVGYDPFTYPSLPSRVTQPPNAWQLITDSGASGLRTALARAGLGDLAIWVTEFGAPTDYPGPADPRTVSDTTQADIVVDGLRLARAANSEVGGYFVDTWRDAKPRGSSRDHFGLLRFDGTRKPAFTALARELAR